MATVIEAVAAPVLEARPRRARPRAANRAGRRSVAAILAIWAAAPVIGFTGSVALLTVLGFAGAIAGIRWPRLGLLSAGVLCTLDPLMNSLIFTGGILRWNTFNYLLLGVTVLWLPLFWRRHDVSLRLIEACAALLAFELIISPDWAHGMQDLAGLCAVFGLYVYLARRRFSRADWYWLGVVCGTLAAAGGLIYFVQKDALPTINPNAWAFFPVTALFAVCVALPCSFGRRGGPAILTGLAGILLVWVFLSGSRGSMLVAAACAIYLVLAGRGIGRGVTLVATRPSSCSPRLRSSPRCSASRWIGSAPSWTVGPRWWTAPATARSCSSAAGTCSWTIRWASGRRLTAVWHEWAGGRASPPPIGTVTRSCTPAGSRSWPKTVSPASRSWRRSSRFALRGLLQRYRGVRALGVLTATALALELVSTEYQSKGLWFIAAAAMAMLGRRSPLRPRRTVAS